MSNQNTYKHGTHNELCDVCGFKYKADELKDRWDGLRVCKYDWEPRHPSDFFRAPEEKIMAGSEDDAGTESGPSYVYTPDDVPDGTFNGEL